MDIAQLSARLTTRFMKLTSIAQDVTSLLSNNRRASQRAEFLRTLMFLPRLHEGIRNSLEIISAKGNQANPAVEQLRRKNLQATTSRCIVAIAEVLLEALKELQRLDSASHGTAGFSEPGENWFLLLWGFSAGMAHGVQLWSAVETGFLSVDLTPMLPTMDAFQSWLEPLTQHYRAYAAHTPRTPVAERRALPSQPGSAASRHDAEGTLQDAARTLLPPQHPLHLQTLLPAVQHRTSFLPTHYSPTRRHERGGE